MAESDPQTPRSELVVFDTPEGIEYFKLCALRTALKIHAAGMKVRHPGGRSPLQVLKQDYGIKASTNEEGARRVSELIDLHPYRPPDAA